MQCACATYQVSFYFHLDFDNRHYFYDKGTCIDFLKLSSAATLSLEVLVLIPQLNLKTMSIDSPLCYISFFSSLALCVLFSYCKKWLSYLSHPNSPYLHGKLTNWASAFYLSFSSTAFPRILNIFIFMNTDISIICIFCYLYFMLFLM